MSPVRQPEATRLKILESALDLFHRGSFTGTSINQIVEKAGITKGALFHYFRGKMELGYAVVDEILAMQVQEEWVKPLATSTDPITDIQNLLNGTVCFIEENPEFIEMGCPLNNLAQEMSAVDETFREKLLAVFMQWEASFEKALRAGIDAGNVRSDVDSKVAAATLVALLEGCSGLCKVHQEIKNVHLVGEGVRYFLEGLRP